MPSRGGPGRRLLAAALSLTAARAAADPLAPPPGGYRVETETAAAEGPWTETVLRFPSAAKSPWPVNDTVWVHLLVPESAARRRAPAVLILPVMAAPNVWIETRFARRFVRDGFVVMWVEMPTQFHRRPAPTGPSGQAFLARTPQRLAANFRQSVLDARRALDVLTSRPEVDPGRTALFGISLGAIVGSVVYSRDPRPRYGVFLLGGADFPSLARDGSLTGPFVRKMGFSDAVLRAAWAGLEPDPRAPGGAPKPALLVNARSDTVIPAANARRLAAVFPEARQVWVPGGHYTAILHMVWMPSWVSARLREALADRERVKIR